MNNFRKTDFSYKPIMKHIKFSNQKINNIHPQKKLISSFSCTNYYYPKSRKIPIFLRTINNFQYDKLRNINQNSLLLKKIKLKKSSSEIFQSNDVDLVRNLNFDSIAQYNDNIQLRESLVNSVKENINDNNNKKENEDVHLPQLSKLAKYKSYEIIQTHKKKIKIELSEQLQKELINKLKFLRNDCQMKKLEKEKIFLNINEIEEQLEEIDAENHYFKEKYKQQINDISKKRKDSPEKKQEIINKSISEKKKKKLMNKGSLMEIFNVDKKENTINKNDYHNQSAKKIINNRQNGDISSIQDQKKLENFEINLLQTQRKKEYESFQKHQNDKINSLKESWKQLNLILNRIDNDLEENKNKEKKIINRLMTYYKEILFKGKNVKKDGLVWIIKAIWNLGENVPMSFLPEFLDFDSIDYLFKLAHKQIEIENCNKRINEVKLKLKREISDKYESIKLTLNTNNKSSNFNESNNLPSQITAKEYLQMKKNSENMENENKKDVYKDLVKEFEGKDFQFEIIHLPEVEYINEIKKKIQKIETEILELKKKEIRRIYRCFIEFDYETKFHTNVETVLSALIGIDAKDTEMNKYNLIKKEYISSLKKIRFFDHEHIRKILSK